MTDGQGYYAYLPAVFLYQDLQFSFVDSLKQTYYKEGKRAKFIIETPDGNVNKYFAGTAVLEAPFFLVGRCLSAVVDAPVDGYSWPFQLVIGLAAIVYLILGLFFLGRLLYAFGFDEKTVRVTLLFTLFGTNLLYYTVYEPSMSHVFSFFTISLFLFALERAHHTTIRKWFFLTAIALGLTILIRPTNGIIVLGLPIVTGGLAGTVRLFKHLFSDVKMLLCAALIVLILAGLQPLSYFAQTGSPIVWSYEGEGFNFLNPEFYNVLFSYRKGLFIYCPILLLALLGVAVGIFKNRGRYAWLAIYLFVSTWIISSWWMWYYGGSYGHRAFIEHYPFFAIGLAALIMHGLSAIKPWVFMTISMVLILLQGIQTYQFNKHIITFDNMTKTKYWNLFLRTGDDLAWYYSGYEGQDSYVGVDSLVVKHDFETERGWGNEHQIIENPTSQGLAAKMTSGDGYGPTFRKPVSEINIALNNVRIKTRVNSNSRNSNVALVCSLEDSAGNSYFWQRYPLRPQFRGAGNWCDASALFRSGAPRDVSDTFVIYPMKTDESSVLLDDFEVSFIQAK
ncbi:hypothetical protein OAL15_01980 [Flavobacteriales bacterium]|nr:hypothetical protein [Flavobacteriales bacterium]